MFSIFFFTCTIIVIVNARNCNNKIYEENLRELYDGLKKICKIKINVPGFVKLELMNYFKKQNMIILLRDEILIRTMQFENQQVCDQLTTSVQKWHDNKMYEECIREKNAGLFVTTFFTVGFGFFPYLYISDKYSCETKSYVYNDFDRAIMDIYMKIYNIFM